MKILCSIAALLCATPVWADDDWAWTRGDTVREAMFTGLVFLDWQSTRYALRHTAARERNPLLGSSPSDINLGVGCVAGAVVHAVVSRMLPRPWRQVWQNTSLVAEMGVVSSNYIIAGGVRFDFDFGHRQRPASSPTAPVSQQP